MSRIRHSDDDQFTYVDSGVSTVVHTVGQSARLFNKTEEERTIHHDRRRVSRQVLRVALVVILRENSDVPQSLDTSSQRMLVFSLHGFVPTD